MKTSCCGNKFIILFCLFIFTVSLKIKAKKIMFTFVAQAMATTRP